LREALQVGLVAASPVRTAAEEISRAEKEQALTQVLRSGIVRESTNLYFLLEYLGRKALADGAEPLKEYTIGVEALGKPADYDPRLDATVRVDIGKLRAKLTEFYQREGAVCPVRLEIPKGQYDATFARVPHLPAPEVHPAAPPKPAESKLRGYLLAAAALVAAAALGFVAARRLDAPAAAAPQMSAELQRFWQPYLQAGRPNLIVYGTPLFVRLDSYFYREPQLNDPDDIRADEEVRKLASALQTTELNPSYKFTGVGEAEALVLLTRLLTEQRAPTSVKRSRNLSWEDLKGRNVVLLGSQKYNPQILKFPYQPKFEADRGRVTNLNPAPGEPSEYRHVFEGKFAAVLEAYSVISVYPGIDPTTRLTALACSANEGTGGAAEYVTRPDTMKEMFEKMGLKPEEPLPAAFQYVIKIKLNEGVPVQFSYVTHHVLAK
jgi:hypothetical protein